MNKSRHYLTSDYYLCGLSRSPQYDVSLSLSLLLASYTYANAITTLLHVQLVILSKLCPSSGQQSR